MADRKRAASSRKAAASRRRTASLHDAVEWALSAGMLRIHDTHVTVNLTYGRGRPMWRKYATLQEAAEVLHSRMERGVSDV